MLSQAKSNIITPETSLPSVLLLQGQHDQSLTKAIRINIFAHSHNIQHAHTKPYRYALASMIDEETKIELLRDFERQRPEREQKALREREEQDSLHKSQAQKALHNRKLSALEIQISQEARKAKASYQWHSNRVA